MTKSNEQKLIILLSINDLGGKGTKKEVLDNIDNKKFMNYSSNDLKTKDNRNELVWRYTLAFVRKHLVQEGYINGAKKNLWEITNYGVDYLFDLCREFMQSNSFIIINSNVIAVQVNVFINKYKEHYSISEKEFLEDVGNSTNEIAKVLVNRIKRYRKIVKILKERYENKCQIDNCQFTFTKANGEKYSEAHHLQPLSNDGSQDEYNVVILCPNHHRIMHYANVIINDRLDNKREIIINNEKCNVIY